MPPEAPGRRTRLKFYLLIGLLFAPVTGMCSMLCFALTDRSYLELPWVQEFTGIDMSAMVIDVAVQNNFHVEFDVS